MLFHRLTAAKSDEARTDFTRSTSACVMLRHCEAKAKTRTRVSEVQTNQVPRKLPLQRDESRTHFLPRVVADSGPAIRSSRLEERGTLEDGDDAGSTETEVVSQCLLNGVSSKVGEERRGTNVGLLPLCLGDARNALGILHRSCPTAKLVHKVESHSESRSAERVSSSELVSCLPGRLFAATTYPFDSSPPEGLITYLPPYVKSLLSTRSWARPGAVRPRAS